MTSRTPLLVALIALTASCKRDRDDDDNDDNTTCEPGEPGTCALGLTCELVVGGEPDCFAPLVVQGRVFDSADDAGIGAARVVARDSNGSAISPVAVTEVDGVYSLSVPMPRDADGVPVGEAFTLRADASGYLSFPLAPRSALPVDPTSAEEGNPWVIENAATNIALIVRDDADDLGAVSGVVEGPAPGGTLVLAGGATAVADRDGSFVVFNVEPGQNVDVEGYLAGRQLQPDTASVSAGALTEGVVISDLGEATASVTGSVQIVNAPGGSVTSVILVLEDTFDPRAIRGEVPPGLRVGDVTGDWSIDGVPDGRYVVLAAFENDDLVRDPDTSIGGTEIVYITVDGGSEDVPGFKVTEALEVFSPGANAIEEVSAPVTLSWADDSSEDAYFVQVFDAFGDEVWTAQGDFDPGGSKPVEVPYDGPLEAGMIYQFKATSMKDGVPLSTTEDLRGVFKAQ